jgi:hypothetical protein
MDTKARFEKLRSPMTGKCWTFLLVAGTESAMIALLNFVIDPYNSFRFPKEKGEVYSVPGKTYNRRLLF